MDSETTRLDEESEEYQKVISLERLAKTLSANVLRSLVMCALAFTGATFIDGEPVETICSVIAGFFAILFVASGIAWFCVITLRDQRLVNMQNRRAARGRSESQSTGDALREAMKSLRS